MAVATLPNRVAVLVTVREAELEELRLEALAACTDAIAGAHRIQIAAAAGSRMAIANEAGRVGHRATQSLLEIRRLAQPLADPA